MGERGNQSNQIHAPNISESLRSGHLEHAVILESDKEIPEYRYQTPSHIVKKQFGKLADNLFSLLDKIPVGIVLISKKTLSVIYANNAFLDIFDCRDVEEAISLSWEDYLYPDNYKEFLGLMTQKKYNPRSLCFQINRKDGETRDVKVFLSDMMSNDKECSLVFFQDISTYEDLFGQSNQENINFDRLLEAFSYRIIEIQEDERRKISYELHDELGQILTAIQLMLSRAKMIDTKHRSPEHDESENLINDAIERVRTLSLDLNPHSIETRGLVPTLKEYFKRFKIWSKITVNFKHTGLQGLDVPVVINNTIYRTIQESLTNAARHAEAETVNISILANEKEIHLDIADKGKGFNPKKIVIGRSSGLSGIYERLLLLKGRLELDTAPGKGTRLNIRIPLPDKSNGKRDSK